MSIFQPKNSDEARELLVWAATLGWSLIPLEGKVPMGGGTWRKRVFAPREFVRRNIGIRFGPASMGMCEIDIDTDQKEDIAKVIAAYKKHNPVLIGRGGNVRRCMFRIKNRPVEEINRARKLAKLPYQTEEGKQAHLALAYWRHQSSSIADTWHT